VAHQADLPHYQEVFSKFMSALEAYDEQLSIFLYLRGEDYKNHFLTLCNSTEKVKPFIEQINWMEVQRIACHLKKKANKSTLKRNDKILTRILAFVLPLTRHKMGQQMASQNLVSSRE
jgi:hypothetical protein